MKIKALSAERRKARIEIIPLIDIMFFLLATFVMVSTAMIHNKAISVNLPVSKTGSQEQRKDFVSLSVTETGEYYLDKQKVDASKLASELENFKKQNPDPRVFINGDKNANLSALVLALDEVRKAGIVKVALETSAQGDASK